MNAGGKTPGPATTMQRVRGWQGPALFAYGFRPFFLFAGIQAAAMIGVWTLWLAGVGGLPTSFPPVAWHAHEMLFGYAIAAVAGFLLTAVPNWTGRLPVVGWPLAALFALWLVGRLAMMASALLGPVVLAVATLLFPIALTGAIAREIIAANNSRNHKVLIVLALVIAAQVLFHVEVQRAGVSVYGERLAIAAYLLLVMVVGGRIVPSFTTNWLKRANPGRVPVPFDGFDKAAMIAGSVGLAAWIAMPALGPASPVAAGLLALAGVAHLLRLARWAPDRVWREPLVAVMHVAYAFIPIGLAFAAAGAFARERTFDTAAIHCWTIGAIGLMTLAVMTRATRGHTGRSLTAPASTAALYILLTAAAIARATAAVAPQYGPFLLVFAGAAWTAAFGGFALLYGPMCLFRQVKT